MTTFKKIYKKITDSSYENIANVGDVNNNEINVFDKIIGGNHQNGLIPTPLASTRKKALSTQDGWVNFTTHKSIAHDKDSISIMAGTSADDNSTSSPQMWSFEIPTAYLLTKDEYNKIEKIKGGYALVYRDKPAKIGGNTYYTYQKLYGNILSAYNLNSTSTTTVGTSDHKIIGTLNNTKSERIRLTDDYISKCTVVDSSNNANNIQSVSAYRGSGGIVIDNQYLNNILLSGVFRVACKSNTKGYVAEVVPFFNAVRTAYQASYIYSGGSNTHTILLTYIFEIPAGSTKTISLYGKAYGGNVLLNIIDANFTVLNAPNSYFLINNSSPISERKQL